MAGGCCVTGFRSIYVADGAFATGPGQQQVRSFAPRKRKANPEPLNACLRRGYEMSLHATAFFFRFPSAACAERRIPIAPMTRMMVANSGLPPAPSVL